MDDLALQIHKTNSRRRLYSWAVLSLLILAFVGTSAFQFAPLLFHKPQAASGASADQAAMRSQIRQLETLVRQHPMDEGMSQTLGNLLYDSGDYAAAARTYKKVLALDPGNPDVRVDYGTCLYYQRQPMEAIAEFKRVLTTHPRFVNAMVNMGIVYDSLGQGDQAAQQWHTALELTTDPKIKAKIKDLLDSLLAPAGN